MNEAISSGASPPWQTTWPGYRPAACPCAIRRPICAGSQSLAPSAQPSASISRCVAACTVTVSKSAKVSAEAYSAICLVIVSMLSLSLGEQTAFSMTSAPLAPQGFCRDCRRDVAEKVMRCPGCWSPRLLRHRELNALAIAHVDCDAFYATIEKRDNPSLADQPVIVGGGQRGVVLTCCYVARTFGVRSAMPMFEARRLCPHAAIVRPRMDKYAEVGRAVRARMRELTPLVEPVSIDEAFMDLSGTERLHGMPPAKALAGFASEVETAIGITVSIGLSCNKFLAK